MNEASSKCINCLTQQFDFCFNAIFFPPTSDRRTRDDRFVSSIGSLHERVVSDDAVYVTHCPRSFGVKADRLTLLLFVRSGRRHEDLAP
jgi:hypothetical protein